MLSKNEEQEEEEEENMKIFYGILLLLHICTFDFTTTLFLILHFLLL